MVVNGSAVTASLQTTADKDDFAVTLNANVTYTFKAAASTGLNALNEILIRSDGVQVAGSSGGTFNHTPTASGTFYISVNSLYGSTGSYTLTTSGSVSSNPSSSVPVYRFFDSNTGTQFLTSSTSERDTVLNTRPDLISEGVGLNAAASTDPNASAVYRFFDTHYGTHFFTSSSSERDTIQATRPDLSYEGIGFYEDATQQANTTPVYRFFDSNRGTHFFTGSATERATILSTRADLIPEGISFYSPNS